MTKEDKQLFLKDLCGRLPYGVICDRLGKHYPLIEIDIKRELVYLLRDDNYVPYSILRGDIIKPYLRPMSSMTEEEFINEAKKSVDNVFEFRCNKINSDDRVLTKNGYISNFNKIEETRNGILQN